MNEVQFFRKYADIIAEAEQVNEISSELAGTVMKARTAQKNAAGAAVARELENPNATTDNVQDKLAAAQSAKAKHERTQGLVKATRMRNASKSS